jgi:putative endonuclease
MYKIVGVNYMNSFKKDIGFSGEEAAAAYLEKMGYKILDRNFRVKSGEIDIIGKEGDYIIFIEVKSRYSTSHGTPSESVTRHKQLKLYKTAELYIMIKKLWHCKFRFDVIEVIFSIQNNNMDIKLIKDAFQLW